MQKACVFNIQHYCVHDGPGIRTIVFMKGCHLRCKWCCNPESHEHLPEIAYNESKCIGAECKICTQTHPQAFSWDEENNKLVVDFSKKTEVTDVADICPAKAITTYGQYMTLDEIVEQVEKDMTFYQRSEGGVTFSGGDPLLQDEFLLEALKVCKKRSIHTCIETTGARPWEIVRPIFEMLDHIYIDLKHVDREKHMAWTGLDNQIVMDNLKNIRREFPDKPILVRTPVIPGFNDSPEEIRAIHDFVKNELNNAPHELLKYHRGGVNKYTFTGREYPLDESLKIEDEDFAVLKEIAEMKE